MVSKHQQQILLFYYKHQEEFIDLNIFKKSHGHIGQEPFLALVEKGYLDTEPNISIDIKDLSFSLELSDKLKITDTGIDLAEQIKQNNRNRISFWNGTIGGIIGAIGGIFGIISFFSS